jgi:hypothetical protein
MMARKLGKRPIEGNEVDHENMVKDGARTSRSICACTRSMPTAAGTGSTRGGEGLL